MQKQITFVLLLLVAVAMGLLWWQSSFGDDLPQMSTDAVEQNDGRSAVVVDVAPQTGDASEDVHAPSDAVPEGLFRTEADVQEVSYLAVQVWDRKEGVAAANADVFVLDEAVSGIDWSLNQGDFRQHFGDQAENLGRKFRANEDGFVEVPNVKGAALLSARLSGTYAFKWLGKDRAVNDVETLVLQNDETITVRVVDQQGQPVAGAAVGIIQRMPREEEAKWTGRMGLQELQQSVQEVRQWMADNPNQAGRASGKLAALEGEFQKARRNAGRSKQRAGQSKPANATEGQKSAMRVEVRVRRETDEKGLAVVEHFQLYRKLAGEKGGKGKGDGKGDGKGGGKGDGKSGGKGRGKGGGKGDGKGGGQGGGQGAWQAPELVMFEAALLMPLQESVTKEFSVAELPEGVIELRMPPTCTLALRTVDRDGRPFTHPVRGELRIASGQGASWSRLMLRKEQNERFIEFPYVGLGLSFLANCRLDDESFRWRTPVFDGPVVASERVEIDLVVAPEAGMLYGQLVDGDGVALAGFKPNFLISAASGRLEGEEVITDDEGRFHLPYEVGANQLSPYRFEVRRHDVVPTKGLAMPLMALPESTVTDLGTLAIDEFGEIAHGVVVNDIGEPIEHASIQLQRERAVGKDGALRFVDETFVTTETDETGQYALFGSLQPGRYRVRAQARDHFDGGELLNTSWQARALQLTRKCRVVGTVLAPEWMNRKRVRVTLSPLSVPVVTGKAAQERSDQLRDYAGKTYAYFDSVRPGSYDLAFSMQGYPDPFLRIDNLQIQAGQVDLHPRLRDLDLGAHIFRFEIHAVNQNGEPVDVNRPQLSKITRANGEQQYVGLVMKGRYGEVFNATPQLEVYPMCEGYVADVQVLSPGRSELVYRAIPPIDLHLPGLYSMAQGVSVQVVLERLEMNGLPDQLESFDGMSRRISGWYRKAKYSASMLDERDTARVALTSGGSHKVILRFGVGRIRPPTVELDAVQINLVLGEQPIRVTVPFDAQVVQQAIAEATQMMQQQDEGGGK